MKLNNAHPIWKLSIPCRQVTNGSNKSRLLKEIVLVALLELKLAGRMIRETLLASNFNRRYFRSSVFPRSVSRRRIFLKQKVTSLCVQSISQLSSYKSCCKNFNRVHFLLAQFRTCSRNLINSCSFILINCVTRNLIYTE